MEGTAGHGQRRVVSSTHIFCGIVSLYCDCYRKRVFRQILSCCETCSEDLASQSHVRTTQMWPLVVLSSLNRNTSVFISGFAAHYSSQVVESMGWYLEPMNEGRRFGNVHLMVMQGRIVGLIQAEIVGWKEKYSLKEDDLNWIVDCR